MVSFLLKDFKPTRYLKVSLIALLPVVLRLLPLEWFSNQHSICVFKNITGHECWGCGMTRAVLSVIHFRFSDAWTYNKLVIIVLPILVWIWVKTLYESWYVMKESTG
jgi:hypothetical protein